MTKYGQIAVDESNPKDVLHVQSDNHNDIEDSDNEE